MSYQRVCGRARGYQKGDTVEFYGTHSNHERTIDEDYVSGLSITYNSNPHQHIWTFVVMMKNNYVYEWACPCTSTAAHFPHSYVGSNY